MNSRSAARLSRASRRLLLGLAALNIVGCVALALLLRRTDAALPWLVVLFAALVVVTYVPWVSLVLPRALD